MKEFLFALFFIISSYSFSQVDKINPDIIPSDGDLLYSLKSSIPGLEQVYRERDKGNLENGIRLLADYFKEKFSERYYFSWKNFRERFSEYSKKYPNERSSHIRRADEHSTLFPASAKWELPSTNLKGENVSAYELRHLARQHKSINAAFAYFYENEKSGRVRYFIDQVKSLNDAFTKKRYDDKGNAVYEVFHAGYRVQNWLFVHALYLASEEYSHNDQAELIRTFLHTGAQIAKRGKKFSYGNHHTKGLTALFLISVLFPEFRVSDQWRKMAVDGLTLHLQREVNDDGFQFERSVHYHMGDIDNYFYVYQLAMINKVELPQEFRFRFRSMFDALVRMAQPGRILPVLQDDTDAPWGEYNEIRNAMTIGALLFTDPVYRYFASERTGAELSWFFSKTQSEFLKSKGRKPECGSEALEKTGYYVMRDGWELDERHMIISAGLSEQKPDHQHGDMLGLVAYAYGNQILPNYQVRYNLSDYEFFKNSFVKNVAIVDSIPHARGWKMNEGQSGFGKWNFIPAPKTLAWYSDENIDYYCGSHNGYDSLGVEYLREIFFIKDGFWIVRDQFIGSDSHDYYQIWQGHYDSEKGNKHIRSTFQNGSGLDIVQLNEEPDRLIKSSIRGKGSVQLTARNKNNYLFETLLYPFKNFETRIIDADDKKIPLSGWNLFKTDNREKIIDTDFTIVSGAEHYIKSEGKYLLTGVTELKIKEDTFKFDKRVNIFLTTTENNILIRLLNGYDINVHLNNHDSIMINEQNIPGVKNILLKPLDVLKIPRK